MGLVGNQRLMKGFLKYDFGGKKHDPLVPIWLNWGTDAAVKES